MVRSSQMLDAFLRVELTNLTEGLGVGGRESEEPRILQMSFACVIGNLPLKDLPDSPRRSFFNVSFHG